MAFLTTERLVLRDVTHDDADELFALVDDPEVMRYINGGKPASRTAARDRTLPEMLRGYPAFGGGRAVWAAEERAGGRFVGWFALRPTDPERPDVADLGYRLRRAAWGLGYATEGARAVVDKGFEELGVRLVVADTMTVNTGSRRVLEKVGLRFVNQFHTDWPDVIEGSEQGDVAYELTRAAWAADHGARG
ncbi:Protein N-acetyltransferase, RimJ/RimL family [Asanoa hainanensis]|uniref:Protein N-acetyltransferase, RimJ/RimL family n=1 Tax=Asanoa hainanensis TaxID=560556 RepID=A0A239M8I8_9ACTN|nr:GNAT family N-acetyltransferase [Asanoa hainanensis]SNT38482.1 Protein N-acetyltransferase, RimJ/RimL family [Asanoa hainanensis]